MQKTYYQDGDSLRELTDDSKPSVIDVSEPTAHSQVGSNDSQARKNMPMASGLLDYFPAALAAVSEVSKVGNDKHNPGEPMHHARGKSMDHADCVIRHLADRGGFDEHGMRHSAYAAWRALALLQQELEDAGEAPLARGARLPADELGPPEYDPAPDPGPPAAQVPPPTVELIDYAPICADCPTPTACAVFGKGPGCS